MYKIQLLCVNSYMIAEKLVIPLEHGQNREKRNKDSGDIISSIDKMAYSTGPRSQGQFRMFFYVRGTQYVWTVASC